jgi:D-proline reductase (dithiol) PrdB
VQRVIEEAGISTICVNMIPDYSRAYGFPRVAALEYPFSLTLGRPGDREGQLQVIRAALQALIDIQEPGGVVHLPFEWPEDPTTVDIHPPEPSPIAKLIGQGKVANPVAVLGQGRWGDIDAILRKGRRRAAIK